MIQINEDEKERVLRPLIMCQKCNTWERHHYLRENNLLQLHCDKCEENNGFIVEA